METVTAAISTAPPVQDLATTSVCRAEQTRFTTLTSTLVLVMQAVGMTIPQETVSFVTHLV